MSHSLCPNIVLENKQPSKSCQSERISRHRRHAWLRHLPFQNQSARNRMKWSHSGIACLIGNSTYQPVALLDVQYTPLATGNCDTFCAGALWRDASRSRNETRLWNNSRKRLCGETANSTSCFRPPRFMYNTRRM